MSRNTVCQAPHMHDHSQLTAVLVQGHWPTNFLAIARTFEVWAA